MRKTGICTKCQHPQLLQILAMPDETDSQYPSTLRVARRLEGEGWLIGEKTRGVGQLTAYVCRKCGFTEMYVDSPAMIEPDGKYILDYTGPTSTEPYR